MIRYHGAGSTGESTRRIWTGRHAMVSFAYPKALPLAAEVASSFALDNGAFTAWKSGDSFDLEGYVEWAAEWSWHPGFDFCLAPDVIDAEDYMQNQELVSRFMHLLSMRRGRASQSLIVPVFHLHEPRAYLRWLVDAMQFRRIALGSSGRWNTPGSKEWWARMNEIREWLIDDRMRPVVQLHGLRMLNPTIFSCIPFASVDSSNADRNVSNEERWQNGYLKGLSKAMRADILAERFENHASAVVWEPYSGQMSMELLG